MQLVLGEPFILACGVVTPKWGEEMDCRRQIVRRLAAEWEAAFIPFQDSFDQACREHPPKYWLPHGVHPSPAGHARMAELWLKGALLVQ